MSGGIFLKKTEVPVQMEVSLRRRQSACLFIPCHVLFICECIMHLWGGSNEC